MCSTVEVLIFLELGVLGKHLEFKKGGVVASNARSYVFEKNLNFS